jgi:YspA SLOG family
MRVAWTGHRPDLFQNSRAARERVLDAARDLVRGETVEQFLVGGQRGVDTWAAEAAHLLKVPFELWLPLAVHTFTADWSADDRAALERTISWAADVHIVGGDAAAAYSRRNRQLATSGDLLVAVWTRREGGGTAETIALARQHGTPVREIVLESSAVAGSARGRGV